MAVRRIGQQAGYELTERQEQIGPLRSQQREIPRPATAGRDDVKHATERVQVGPLVKRSALQLLGSGIRARGDRPQDIGADGGDRRVKIPEVSDVPFVEPDVVG